VIGVRLFIYCLLQKTPPPGLDELVAIAKVV
jgi:hypothetical protein